jgi:predicted RNase H-like HicB family nuclease
MNAQQLPRAAAARPRYRMEITWSDEDEAYLATVPDLPGCVTHGATYAEAARMGEDAIDAWLAGARHWGRPIPLPGGVRGPREGEPEPGVAAPVAAVALPPADLARIERAIVAVLLRYRRHWHTAGDLQGRLPGIPEAAITGVLEGLVAIGQLSVSRGTSRTSYRLTPAGADAGEREGPF